MKRVKRTGRPLDYVFILPSQTNQTSKTLLEKWQSDVDKYIEESCDPDSFPSEGEGFTEKREAAKKCSAYATGLYHYIEARYSWWLSIKKDPGILKWQWKLIKKKPNLKTAFEIFRYIKQHAIPYHEGIKIANRRNIPKFKTEKDQEKDYLFFTPDYNQMELKLGLKRRQIQKYLSALSRTESKILVDFGKMGPRKNRIFGVGYWLAGGLFL